MYREFTERSLLRFHRRACDFLSARIPSFDCHSLTFDVKRIRIKRRPIRSVTRRREAATSRTPSAYINSSNLLFPVTTGETDDRPRCAVLVFLEYESARINSDSTAFRMSKAARVRPTGRNFELSGKTRRKKTSRLDEIFFSLRIEACN